MNNSVSNATEKKLPRGWRWVALGDVCTVQKGATPRIGEYVHSGLRLIKFRDIGGKTINWAPGFRSFVSPECARKLRQLKVGMTLIGADAHNPEFIGKKVTFVDDIPEEPAYFSGEIIAVAPKANCPVISEWPFFYLSSHDGYKAMQEKVVGVHLNKTPAERIEILLPPLAEQKRIVAVLNKQMAAVEKARAAALERVEAVRALPSAFLREIFSLGDGELPHGWQWVQVKDAITKIKHTTKIQKKNYLKNGNYPIIDQSRKFISGYWDNENDLFKVKKPVVIFGDHTRILKYVDFDFVWGADGVVILQPRDGINEKFFYYVLKNISVESLGYSRHYKALQNHRIPCPSLAEQKRIVATLNEKMATAEKARVAAEAELEAITALPAALLRKAFSGTL